MTKPIDIDYSDLESKHTVEKQTGYGSIILIDNLPKVDDKKLSKLSDVLQKLIRKQLSKKSTDAILSMPMLETRTQGFAFACLANGDDAALVVKGLDGYRLDKSHVLAVNFFDDVETYGAMEDEYVEPEIAEFEEKEHLKSWL